MIKKFITITATVPVAADETDTVTTIEEAKDISVSVSEALEYLEELGWKLKLEHFETEEDMNKRVEYEKKNRVFTSMDIKTIRVESHVRYWEDTDVNGEEDNKDNPTIPGANGEMWEIEIDTNTGKIKNWPKGTTADVHYKTCDENKIIFKDEFGDVLGEYECYVPDFLCINDSGYGDYIIMEIEEDGKITDFSFDDEDLEDIKENAF